MEKIIYLNMVEMERNHWWYKGRREIITNILKSYLRPNMQILDAGCGAGGMMECLSKYGQVTGIDVSKEMVEHCRNIGLSATCDSILKLPFQDHFFDLVLCLDVLEHLPDEMTALEELKRVIKPEGVLVLSVPAFSWLWSDHDNLNNHYRRYNAGELVEIIKKSNLSLKRSTYFNAFLLPLIWLVRKFGRRIFDYQQRTDFEMGSGMLNNLFYNILRLEQFVLSYLNLPVGVSQIVIAKRN